MGSQSYRTGASRPNRAAAGPQAAQPQPAASTGPAWMNYLNGRMGNAAVVELVAGETLTEDEATEALAGGRSEGEEAPSSERTPDTGTHDPQGVLKAPFETNQARVDAGLSLTLDAAKSRDLETFVTHWNANKARYEAVAAQTGFPAALIAAIHWREGSGNFGTYLHQGDPLGRPAVHVPTDIPVFDVWEDAAVHALQMKDNYRTDLGITSETTDTATLATFAEGYNGLGYHNRGVSSAYVWAGTDAYTSGKYVADGVYSSTAVDQQLGVVAMMDAVGALDQDITPQTREQAWQKVVSGELVLRMGKQGLAVEALQEKLGLEAVDGDFGRGTYRAVVAFQRANGLEPDGVVGPGTAAKLGGATASTSSTET